MSKGGFVLPPQTKYEQIHQIADHQYYWAFPVGTPGTIQCFLYQLALQRMADIIGRCMTKRIASIATMTEIQPQVG